MKTLKSLFVGFLVLISSHAAHSRSQTPASDFEKQVASFAAVLLSQKDTDTISYSALHTSDLMPLLLSEELRGYLEKFKVIPDFYEEFNGYGTLSWCEDPSLGCRLKLTTRSEEEPVIISTVLPGNPDGSFCFEVKDTILYEDDSTEVTTDTVCPVSVPNHSELWKLWGAELLRDLDWGKHEQALVKMKKSRKEKLFDKMVEDGLFSVVIAFGMLDDHLGKPQEFWTDDLFLLRKSSAVLQKKYGLEMVDGSEKHLKGFIKKNIPFEVRYQAPGSPAGTDYSTDTVNRARALGTFLSAINQADLTIYSGHSRDGRGMDFGVSNDPNNQASLHIGSVPFNWPLFLYPDRKLLRFRQDTPQVFTHLGCNASRLYSHRLGKIMKAQQANEDSEIWALDGDLPITTEPILHLLTVSGLANNVDPTKLQKFMGRRSDADKPGFFRNLNYNLKKKK